MRAGLDSNAQAAPVGQISLQVGDTFTAVVPAKAGTHNPSEKLFGSALSSIIARSEATKQSRVVCAAVDCFAEPVIGPRFAWTRWLAMTW